MSSFAIGASAQRIGHTAAMVMRVNRVLLILLMIWPCALSAILWAVGRGRPAADDVRVILQQELFYGLVLVGLGASVALGTELRAHRIAGVLGRAVGRTEYLLALGASAFLPFAGYVLVLAANAALWNLLLHPPLLHVPSEVGAEFVAGVLICAFGLLFSVCLPQVPAAIATGVVLSGLVLAARYGLGGLAAPFAAAQGAVLQGLFTAGVGLVLGLALLLLVIAAALFAGRDLRV